MRARSASGRLLVGVLALGLALRGAQAALRWDEIALAYAAYSEPVTAALGRLDPAGIFGNWVGLHPPLFAILHGLQELIYPAPALWMGTSALLSLGAVWLVGRVGGALAALALATAPLQVAHAAEVNNYPLAVFASAAVLAASRAPWGWLAAAVVLAGWSHLLAGVGGLGVLGWRLLHPRRAGERWPLLAAVGLGLLPVGAGALRLMGQGSTWSQPALDLARWAALVVQAVGWPGLLLGAVALVGLRQDALVAWLSVGAVLGASLLAGAAAPHQTPYLLLLGPAAAVALGRLGRSRPRWSGVVALLCLAQGLGVGLDLGARASRVGADLSQERAIDVAIARSRPGDTLWLLAPALQADDDKTATSSVLWRLRPWAPMPIARPVPFDYTDWRYGQPRVWRGRVVHSSTELALGPFDQVVRAALSRDADVYVVLYEHGPATGLLDRVRRALRPYRVDTREFVDADGLGGDRLYHLRGLR